MQNPLGHYTSPAVVGLLVQEHGNYLERMTPGDKAAILAVIGIYLHGKLENLDEYQDEERYSELLDGWNDYPLVCSEAVEEAVHVLNPCDDASLLGLAHALLDYLRGAG